MGEIRSGQTPGKFWAKNVRREGAGSLEREEKWEEGAKRVQVKDLSAEGMAMNMKEPPGQMCKWFGEMAKVPSAVGAMRNSHHSVSMYDCW